MSYSRISEENKEILSDVSITTEPESLPTIPQSFEDPFEALATVYWDDGSFFYATENKNHHVYDNIREFAALCEKIVLRTDPKAKLSGVNCFLPDGKEYLHHTKTICFLRYKELHPTTIELLEKQLEDFNRQREHPQLFIRIWLGCFKGMYIPEENQIHMKSSIETETIPQ